MDKIFPELATSEKSRSILKQVHYAKNVKI